ncbi:hypothetical protein VTO42DRAFT_2098 [Malbranchea cinnamomea]
MSLHQQAIKRRLDTPRTTASSSISAHVPKGTAHLLVQLPARSAPAVSSSLALPRSPPSGGLSDLRACTYVLLVLPSILNLLRCSCRFRFWSKRPLQRSVPDPSRSQPWTRRCAGWFTPLDPAKPRPDDDSQDGDKLAFKNVVAATSPTSLVRRGVFPPSVVRAAPASSGYYHRSSSEPFHIDTSLNGPVDELVGYMGPTIWGCVVSVW